MESTDFLIVGLVILVAFVVAFVYLARRSARRFEAEKHHRRNAHSVPYPASTSSKSKGRRRR